MLLPNPYDAVNIDAIRIIPSGVIRGQHIFKIETSAHRPFDACVFRDHLVRFLFEQMRDPWHLGNDDTYIVFSTDDLALALSPRDAKRFDDYGWVN